MINPSIVTNIVQKYCGSRRQCLLGLSLALVYFVSAKLGLTFTVVADNVTLIWPPSGLSLFALLVLGRQYWPWIALGAFATNLTTGISLFACFAIAAGNTLEAVVGFTLLRRFAFDTQLSHVRDVLYLAVFAAGFSTMVSATLGAFSLAASGAIPWIAYPTAWVTWWMGDAMGVLVFTPLLLSWWLKYPKPITRAALIEALVLLIGVASVTGFVFGVQTMIFEQPLPLAYTTFPFILWAAMRFGMRGATTTTLVIGGIILLSIMFQYGLFATGGTLQSLTLLWLYTNFLAITSLILTAAVEERQTAERGMRHLAEHDHLTHLPNRRALVDRIEKAIAHTDRSGEKFALLFLDLDRFKVVNDSLGHSKGDEMLTVVSQRLLDSVRKEDTVSRLGGDEFIILVQGIDKMNDICTISKKVINNMHEPLLVGGLEIHSSVSIGICVYPNDGGNAETLLKHADIAMYRAKEMGRDNYQFYAPEMNEKMEARLSIESDLRNALKNDEFLLHYQPQYHVKDGRIKGGEALLRWCKEGEICIGPDIFIPVLEETGKIKEVGAWVVEQACRQLSIWNAKGWGNLRMSVNISSHQLTDPHLPETIAAAITRHAIKPEYLELEITESMLVRQDATVEDVIQRLVALGVRLAVDDFGTGYSSLSYLHRLSIDTLKVDRSFVEKIPGNDDCETIARAIVGLGKSLQLTVVAEGVENDQQGEFLCSLGCDYIQGYLLSKPVTAEAFTQLLETDCNRLNKLEKLNEEERKNKVTPFPRQN